MWYENQVHMICHQAIGVDTNVKVQLPFDQVIQIVVKVGCLNEYRFVIVTALHNVMRKAWYKQTW